MGFPSLALSKHVSCGDCVTGTVIGGFTITDVKSSDSSVRCTLANSAPITTGPSNTVTITCTIPEGSATTHTAVVTVTMLGT